MLSKEKLQQLAHLQVQICTCDERIRYLIDKIDMLSTSPCKTVVNFQIYNEDQHQINEGQKAVDKLNEVELFVLPGFLKARCTSMPSPTTQFSYDLCESQAINVLNYLFKQEKADRAKHLQQMESLLKELMIHPGQFQDEPMPNPIMELHMANA